MSKLAYVRTIALFMSVLIVTLPIIFAEEYSMLYDANGNLVYDSETNVYREYNELNQLIRTRINNASGTILQEYTWEPLQERIFIKDGFYSNGSLESSTYYFYQDYIVIQNSSGTYNRTNIHQDGTLLGYEDFDGIKRYVLPDHKGTAHLILNESGDIIEENLFSPFAEPLAGVKENKFSYEAKEYDSLTKDYNFNFRTFSPNGPPIFNQPDTLIQNVYDPQSLNRYSFERNNAYAYTDSDGHIFAAIIAIVTVVVTTIVAAVIGYVAGYTAGAVGSAGAQVASKISGKSTTSTSQQSTSSSTPRSISTNTQGSSGNARGKISNFVNAVKSIDWKRAHETGKEFGKSSAVIFGTQGLVDSISLNFGSSSTTSMQKYPRPWSSPQKFGLRGPGEARQVSPNTIERVRLDFGHSKGGYDYPHWNKEIYQVDDLAKVLPNSEGSVKPIQNIHEQLYPQLPSDWWDK